MKTKSTTSFNLNKECSIFALHFPYLKLQSQIIIEDQDNISGFNHNRHHYPSYIAKLCQLNHQTQDGNARDHHITDNHS
jgi:hypothetical protein